MAKFPKVVIDVQKTLGALSFLRKTEKAVYENGVATNKFNYEIVLLSELLQGEVVISKFPKDIELPYLAQVELVGEVLLNSTVSGAGDFRTVSNTITVEDIKLKGQAQNHKQDQK